MGAKQQWIPSINESVQIFLDESRLRLKPSTIANYRDRLKRLTVWLEDQGITHVDGITQIVLRKYFQKMINDGLATHTIVFHSKVIRRWVNALIEIEILDKSPMRGVKLPKLPKLVKLGFTPDELRKLLKVAKPKEEIVLLVLVDTGCRSSEFCAIDGGDVDLATGTIRIRQGKGNKDRIAFIGSTTKKTLARYWRINGKPGDNEPLVESQTAKDGRLTRSGMKHILRRLGERSGVADCAPHRCRRTFAQLSKNNGMSIRDIQLILGHSDIRTTIIYLGDDINEISREHSRFGPIDHSL